MKAQLSENSPTQVSPVDQGHWRTSTMTKKPISVSQCGSGHLGCLPLSAYCDAYHDTPAAVDKRIREGIWMMGVHIHRVSGFRERWVDLDAINAWVRSGSGNASCLPVTMARARGTR